MQEHIDRHRRSAGAVRRWRAGRLRMLDAAQLGAVAHRNAPAIAAPGASLRPSGRQRRDRQRKCSAAKGGKRRGRASATSATSAPPSASSSATCRFSGPDPQTATRRPAGSGSCARASAPRRWSSRRAASSPAPCGPFVGAGRHDQRPSAARSARRRSARPEISGPSKAPQTSTPPRISRPLARAAPEAPRLRPAGRRAPGRRRPACNTARRRPCVRRARPPRRPAPARRWRPTAPRAAADDQHVGRDHARGGASPIVAPPKSGSGTCRSHLMPGSAGVMQARRFGVPSTVTRQSWQTPMPQKMPRSAPPLRCRGRRGARVGQGGGERLARAAVITGLPSKVKVMSVRIGPRPAGGRARDEARHRARAPGGPCRADPLGREHRPPLGLDPRNEIRVPVAPSRPAPRPSRDRPGPSARHGRDAAGRVQFRRLERSRQRPAGAEAQAHHRLDPRHVGHALVHQPVGLAQDRALQAVQDEALDLVAERHGGKPASEKSVAPASALRAAVPGPGPVRSPAAPRAGCRMGDEAAGLIGFDRARCARSGWPRRRWRGSCRGRRREQAREDRAASPRAVPGRIRAPDRPRPRPGGVGRRQADAPARRAPDRPAPSPRAAPARPGAAARRSGRARPA
jgi:hypothetical protein